VFLGSLPLAVGPDEPSEGLAGGPSILPLSPGRVAMYVGVIHAVIEDPEAFREDLADIVRALARINMRKMASGRFAPLYDSHIRWSRTRPYVATECDGDVCHAPERADLWQDRIALEESGEGDCKDLVAVRLAELWLMGDRRADVQVILFPDALGPNYDLYHVVLRRGDGVVEDPSRERGMDQVA